MKIVLKIARSPLLHITLAGLLVGLTVGLFSLTTSRFETEPASGQVQVQAIRKQTAWKLVKKPRENAPGEFDYTESRAVAQTVSANPNGEELGNVPIWKEMIENEVLSGDFHKAIRFLSEIHAESDRVAALSYIISAMSRQSISVVPMWQYYNTVPMPQSSSEVVPAIVGDNQEQQKLLHSFAIKTSTEIQTALEVAADIHEHGSRAKLLISIASIQRALDNSHEADETTRLAKDAYAKYEAGRNGAWKVLWDQFFVVFGYVWKFGFGALFSALALKVAAHYLVKTVANIVGSEEFAKALGTTIKTAKKSGLIIPERFDQDSDD